MHHKLGVFKVENAMHSNSMLYSLTKKNRLNEISKFVLQMNLFFWTIILFVDLILFKQLPQLNYVIFVESTSICS